MRLLRAARGRGWDGFPVASPGLCRAIVALVVISCCSMMAGCQAQPAPAEPADPERPGAMLFETGPMPPEPPAVTFQGQAAQRLVSRWIVDRRVVDEQPPDESSIELPSISHSGSELSVTISHTTVPPTLYLDVFEELDSSGLPVGAGERIECVPQSDRCSLALQEDGLVLRIALDSVHRPVVVVLQSAYTVWPDIAESVPEAPALLTASWGAILTS